MTKRIVALFLALVTLFSLVPSASAAESSVSVWDWIKALSPAAAAGSALYDVVVGSGDEDVTPVDRYDQYVSTLPSNGYSSDGSLLWYPTWDDLGVEKQVQNNDGNIVKNTTFGCWCSSRFSNSVSFPLDSSSLLYHDFTYTVGPDRRSINVFWHQSGSVGLGSPGSGPTKFVVPLDGTYRVVDSLAYVCSYSPGDGGGLVRVSGAYDSEVDSSRHVIAGDSFSCRAVNSTTVNTACTYVSGTMYFPVFRVVPDMTADNPAPDYTTIYNNTTRMGNIGGNYGTVNNDNSVTQYTTQYIVNEGDKTYTNPVTGQSRPIVDWSYDYDDRSYSLNFEGGDTTTVTYGDEKVSINETTIDGNGNTVTNKYEVNYIVNNGGGSDDPSPSPSPSSPVPSTNPGGGSGSGSGSGSVNPLSRVFANYAATITQAYGTDGHGGTDCVPTSGVADTVTAHSEGDVVWVQTGQSNNQGTSGDLSYGNAVKIKHSNSYYTLYAHLATVEVSQGQHVYKGQALGQMGDTGNSYGAHLHFEVRDSMDARINSDPYLNADLPGLEGGGKTEDDRSIWDKLGDLIGTGVNGLLSLVEAVVSKVLDGLISLLEMLTSKLTAVVETVLSVFDQLPALFGGFLDLLGLLFPYLPEEITLLLTFGIIAVVAIWIIKAFKGR